MLKPILKTIALTLFIAAGGVGTSSAAVVVGSDGHVEQPRPVKAPPNTSPKPRPKHPPRAPAKAP